MLRIRRAAKVCHTIRKREHQYELRHRIADATNLFEK